MRNFNQTLAYYQLQRNKQRVNHALHIFLTFMTWFWLPIYLIAIRNAQKKRQYWERCIEDLILTGEI